MKFRTHVHSAIASAAPARPLACAAKAAGGPGGARRPSPSPPGRACVAATGTDSTLRVGRLKAGGGDTHVHKRTALALLAQSSEQAGRGTPHATEARRRNPTGNACGPALSARAKPRAAAGLRLRRLRSAPHAFGSGARHAPRVNAAHVSQSLDGSALPRSACLACTCSINPPGQPAVLAVHVRVAAAGSPRCDDLPDARHFWRASVG